MKRLTGLDNQALFELYPNHWIHENSQAAVILLQQQAAKAGFDLRLASSYRSFAQQCKIWNEKFNGNRPVYDPHGRPVVMSKLNELEKIKAICYYSAIPGTSRHHWGTDMDVYDAAKITRQDLQLIPEEYQANGPCSALFDWMIKTLPTLEFSFPYLPPYSDTLKIANEPWHISHNPVASVLAKQLTPTIWLSELNDVTAQIAGFNTLKMNLDSLFCDYVQQTV